MATARELLEQADSLMRRNRLSEPQSAAADIPELTDAIAVDAAETIEIRPIPSTLADVPELTDAVEEIEAPSILAMPEDDGEPSQWMRIDRGEVSVTGAAPDSRRVAPVSPPLKSPPTSAAIDLPAPGRSAGAAIADSDAALAAATAAREWRVAATVEPVQFPSLTFDDDPVFAPQSAGAVEAVDIEETIQVSAPVAKISAPMVSPSDPEPEADRLFDVGPAADSARLAALEPSWRPESEAGSVAAPERSPASEVDPVAPASPPLLAVPAADETERWNALAEEIRMQVLQRIDIFTDTGLQEQLAARLQPIVDRASADLVATINQQVGQLLRAYVAEAIEREIDKWRQGGE